MSRTVKNFPRVFAGIALAGSLCAPAAGAGLPELPPAPVVSDQLLSQIRGKYVPPQSAQTPVSHTVYANALDAPRSVPQTSSVAAGIQSADASPLSGIPAGRGQVTYFGVEMVSTWTQPGASGTQGAAVGVNVGIDLAHGSVSIGKWSSSTGGGLSNTPGNGTVSGLATANSSTGIGQSIQVAGNGNTISNSAVVQVGTSFTPAIVPTTNTCTQQCTITVGPQGIGIGISTAQGTVLQSIGPNGILQSAQVTSDMNTITNQLGAQVRIVPTTTFNPGSLLPILQTLGGIQ